MAAAVFAMIGMALAFGTTIIWLGAALLFGLTTPTEDQFSGMVLLFTGLGGLAGGVLTVFDA